MSFGSMKHDKVMRSMELFAKKVMPKFRYSCARRKHPLVGDLTVPTTIAKPENAVVLRSCI